MSPRLPAELVRLPALAAVVTLITSSATGALAADPGDASKSDGVVTVGSGPPGLTAQEVAKTLIPRGAPVAEQRPAVPPTVSDLRTGCTIGSMLDGIGMPTHADPAFFDRFEQAAAASAPFAALARCTLASLFIDHGRYELAEGLLSDIAQALGTPEDYAHHAFIMGRLHQARGDFASAAERYRFAFDTSPSHTDAACNFVDLTLAQPTPEAITAAGEVLTAIPVVARRNHLQLSYNEALWREASGEHAAALAVVDALLEAPLGGLESPVRGLRARLVRAGAEG